MLDEDDINSHLFEASNASLSMDSVNKGAAALREGWQDSYKSFNGSDLDSTELTNSSNSLFNVKEKSDRQMPSRRTRILSLKGNNKELVVVTQPTNNLLGILEGSSTYEFTPDLISPKRISDATIGCEHRVTKVDRKSVISMIQLQEECKQHHVIDVTDVSDEEESPIIQYHSPSKQSKKCNTSTKSKLDSKRKQRDSPKSTTSSKQSPNIHRQSKRGMSEESITSTLFRNDKLHEDSLLKNLKRHEKFVSPTNKKITITKETNKNNRSPSLDDFLTNYSNQTRKHNKVSMKQQYILNTKTDQTISVSSVSYTSIDSNDIMPPKLSYEKMIPSLSNSFPSPKIDSTNRKKLSIHNRLDMNRSVSSSIFNKLSSSWQMEPSDDAAPKQPLRCQSPPHDR